MMMADPPPVAVAIAWRDDRYPYVVLYTENAVRLDGPQARVLAARLLALADTWDALTSDG
jgi:hypothetical protein